MCFGSGFSPPPPPMPFKPPAREPYEPVWSPMPWHERHPFLFALVGGVGLTALLWLISR